MKKISSASFVLIYILFSLVLCSPANSASNKWKLFSNLKDSTEKIYHGEITLSALSAFKQITIQHEPSIGGRKQASLSRGTVFRVFYDPSYGASVAYPETHNAFSELKAPNSSGRCVNFQFSPSSLENLQSEEVSTELTYKSKGHQWYTNGLYHRVLVGFADDTKGRTLPQFLDYIAELCMLNKGSAKEVDIKSAFAAFSSAWKKNYFDPIFGTDTTWGIYLSKSSDFVVVKLINEFGTGFFLTFDINEGRLLPERAFSSNQKVEVIDDASDLPKNLTNCITPYVHNKK